MSTPAIIMWAVVLAVGLPATRWNPTAGALSIAWLLGEVTWMMTGNSFPLTVYFMTDVAVISIIYAKTIRRVGPKTYPTLGRQLYCLIIDLTPYDRWIVGIFTLGMWPAYCLMINPWWKWHTLWVLAIAQFLLAGAEAAQSFVAHLRTRAAPDPPDSSGLAWAGFEAWSTRLR